MGGSESKATVLESVIKNLKKGLGGDYGVKMMPNRQPTTVFLPAESHGQRSLVS